MKAPLVKWKWNLVLNKIYDKMKITSINPLHMESSTTSPKEHPETLRSMCNWWRIKKDEDLPDICQWLENPPQNVFSIRNTNSKFHFYPYNPLAQDAHPQNNSPSVSLVLILGGVLIILFISMIITCIKKRKEAQVGSQANHC